MPPNEARPHERVHLGLLVAVPADEPRVANEEAPHVVAVLADLVRERDHRVTLWSSQSTSTITGIMYRTHRFATAVLSFTSRGRRHATGTVPTQGSKGQSITLVRGCGLSGALRLPVRASRSTHCPFDAYLGPTRSGLNVR